MDNGFLLTWCLCLVPAHAACTSLHLSAALLYCQVDQSQGRAYTGIQGISMAFSYLQDTSLEELVEFKINSKISQCAYGHHTIPDTQVLILIDYWSQLSSSNLKMAHYPEP